MAFILRRLVFYVVAIFVAITFNFLMPRLMPGDPVEAMFAAAGGRLPPLILRPPTANLLGAKPAAAAVAKPASRGRAAC